MFISSNYPFTIHLSGTRDPKLKRERVLRVLPMKTLKKTIKNKRRS
jgi:hypothetical protein